MSEPVSIALSSTSFELLVLFFGTFLSFTLKGVGKSCILLRYSEDAFDPNFIATIGIDYRIKTITIAGKRVRLQVWDTSGNTKF